MSSEKAFAVLVNHIRRADTLPAILPIAKPSYGNKVSFSENKSRRTWKPNITHRSWPVTVLGGRDAHTVIPMRRTPRFEVRVADMRRIERAGGLEAMLVSTEAKYLTDYGTRLRAAVFAQMHRHRDTIYLERQEQEARAAATQPPAPLPQPERIGSPSGSETGFAQYEPPNIPESTKPAVDTVRELALDEWSGLYGDRMGEIVRSLAGNVEGTPFESEQAVRRSRQTRYRRK